MNAVEYFPPMNVNEWLRVEPPSTAPDGVLDAVRWRKLNQLLSVSIRLSREELIDRFCRDFRLPRQTVEGALATYRHFGPDSWQ
jgi:hypothetical protein